MNFQLSHLDQMDACDSFALGSETRSASTLTPPCAINRRAFRIPEARQADGRGSSPAAPHPAGLPRDHPLLHVFRTLAACGPARTAPRPPRRLRYYEVSRDWGILAAREPRSASRCWRSAGFVRARTSETGGGAAAEEQFELVHKRRECRRLRERGLAGGGADAGCRWRRPSPSSAWRPRGRRRGGLIRGSFWARQRRGRRGLGSQTRSCRRHSIWSSGKSVKVLRGPR